MENNNMLNVSNKQIFVDAVKQFNVAEKLVDSFENVILKSITTVENIVKYKQEIKFDNLNKILEVYQITGKEFMSFMKNYVNDEYLPKFKEMELELGYRLYDDIGNSNMSDENKINYKEKAVKNVADNNIKKGLLGLAKMAIGGVILLAGADKFNESQDDQKTRRARYKYNNKK